MSGLSASPVLTFVTLQLNGASCGLVKVSGVTLDAVVDDVRALVKEVFSDDLVGVGRAHIKLFLSDEANIEVPFRSPTDTALKPNRTLSSEVLDRLNPTGAGAGAVFPDTLYLVAVVEGACAGGGVVV